MSEPLVSIILTYYNHAAYIAQAIESALNQTYQNLELIVVNDSSPDTPEFEEIVVRYRADPRLQILHQPNQGVAVARNNGLALSKGQYLCLLDSDDYLHPEKLARQIAILEAEPELGMVYCDIQQVAADGQFLDTLPMTRRAFGPLEPNVFEALWITGFFEPSTPIFRRQWYDKVGPFTVGIEGHSDYEFWVRLSVCGCTARYLPERLLYYRIHDKNVSKNAELMPTSGLKARNLILKKFPDKVMEQALGVHAKLFRLRNLTEEQEALIHNQQQAIYQLQETTYQLQQSLENQKQALQQLHERRETEQTEKAEIAQERYRLSLLLARCEQDLRALQQTRSVRLSQMIGRLIYKLRKR